MGQIASTSQLRQQYHLQKVKLGEGAFGTVWRAVHRKTGRVVAVKQLCRESLTASGVRDERPDIEREVSIMKSLSHPHITELYDTFEDSNSIYVVLEYCDGGDFGDKILERGMDIQESELAHWVQQMCSAIAFLHSKRICHRDIKPDNFLIAGTDSLKLADLGLSTVMMEKKVLDERCGTPAYMAPELHGLPRKSQGYGLPVDVWAAGTTMYVVMFGGRHPFLNAREELDEKALYSGALDFREGGAGFLDRLGGTAGLLGMVGMGAGLRMSAEARQTCQSMVTPDPARRCTCERLLESPWLKAKAKPPASPSPLASSPPPPPGPGEGGRLHHLLKPVAVKPIKPSEASLQAPLASGYSTASGPGKAPAVPATPLKVTIVGAKGLRKSDMLGLLPGDPYCIFEIPGKSNAAFKTHSISKTLDPLWNHEAKVAAYAFGDSLCFTVRDKDVVKSDDLLGRVTLSAQEFNPYGFQGHLQLVDAGKGVRATLMVKISMDAQQPCCTMGSSLRSAAPQLRVQPLRVSVIGAKGLARSDMMGTLAGDPYCTIEVSGRSTSKFQTGVLRKTRDPFWNYEIDVPDYAFGDTIAFTVLDKDLVKQDDLLGQVSLSSRQFLPGGFEGELPLLQAGGASPTLMVRIEAVAPARNGAPAPQLVQEPPPADHVLWEVAVRGGFRPVPSECHAVIEAQYRAFLDGSGSATARVVSLGQVMLIDFRVMLQSSAGGGHEREVRRRVI